MIDEYLDFIQERKLFSNKTISIDLDKFISGESNKLLIGGLSGAGKSTLCVHLSKKYKAECFMTDKCVLRMKNVDKFLGEKNRSLKIMKDIFREGYFDCVRPGMKNNKRQVIEGGFLWEGYVLFPETRSYLNQFPVIIIGSSALKASFKVFKRSKEKHDFLHAVKKIPMIYDRNFKSLSKQIDLFRKERLKAGGEVKEFKIPKL